LLAVAINAAAAAAAQDDSHDDGRPISLPASFQLCRPALSSVAQRKPLTTKDNADITRTRHSRIMQRFCGLSCFLRYINVQILLPLLLARLHIV